MATNPKFSLVARNAMGDALITAFGNGALLKVYTGTQPASVDTALSGNTLLGTLTCATPFAAAASGGVVTAGTITQDSSADNSGTATFFRIFKSDGTTAVHDGTVGTSAADLILNTTTIVSGGPISVSSLTITIGS